MRLKVKDREVSALNGTAEEWPKGTTKDVYLKLSSTVPLSQCDLLKLEIWKDRTWHSWAATIGAYAKVSTGKIFPLRPDNPRLKLERDSAERKTIGFTCQQ